MRKILHGESERRNDDLDVEDRDSSGSDTDDDTEKLASAVLMPVFCPHSQEICIFFRIYRKKISHLLQTIKLRSALLHPAKRVFLPKNQNLSLYFPSWLLFLISRTNEGLNEETVRKYLRRKPHTTKELLAKFKGKCADMPKAEIVTRLAAILKVVTTLECHLFINFRPSNHINTSTNRARRISSSSLSVTRCPVDILRTCFQ